MSRKNTDSAKEHFKRLSREIGKSQRGREELEQLFESKPPKSIFSLPPGPARDAHAAELVSEMREIARDLAEAKSAEPAKKKSPKKGSKKKSSNVASRSSGRVDGFSYDIIEMKDGSIVAKINRKGRNIIEHEGAPKIYDSPRLRRFFSLKDDAEFEVRRVINSAMVWYDERGIVPTKKARRSKAAGRGVRRRTSEHRSAIAAEEAERKRIARKKKAAQDRRARLRDEKVRENPGPRNLRHIPRGNPGKPFSFKHSESSAEKQAVKSMKSFLDYKEKWERSLGDGKPKFSAVMKAYDAAENARANFFLAGEQGKADRVDMMRKDLRRQIVDIFNTCFKHLSGQRKSNPGSEEHLDIARSQMKSARDAMRADELVTSYGYMAIASENYRLAGDLDKFKKTSESAKSLHKRIQKKMQG